MKPFLFCVIIVTAACICASAAAAPAGGGYIKSVDLGHGAVTMLSMTQDGSFTSAATEDGSILLLSRNTGPIWKFYYTKSNARNSVASIHPMGTEVLGASGPGIYFINYSGFASWSDPRDLQANIYDVSLSTDGYAYSTGGNRLYVFNKEKTLLFSLNTASAVWRLALSPEGAFIGLATSSPDNRIYLYDRNESLRWTYDPKNTISDIDVTYQAGRIAAGAGSNIYFFSRDGTLLGAYDCGSQVNGVSLTRDGSRAAVGLQDGNVKIVTDRGEVLWQYQIKGRVYDVVMSSDGTQLAVAADNSVQWFAPDIPQGAGGSPETQYSGPAGTGAVSVSSVPPGANIFVDNIYKGLTPLTVTDLASGGHSITVRQQGYADWTANVQVIQGSTIAITTTLTPVSPAKTQVPLPTGLALIASAMVGVACAVRAGRAS